MEGRNAPASQIREDDERRNFYYRLQSITEIRYNLRQFEGSFVENL